MRNLLSLFLLLAVFVSLGAVCTLTTASASPTVTTTATERLLDGTWSVRWWTLMDEDGTALSSGNFDAEDWCGSLVFNARKHSASCTINENERDHARPIRWSTSVHIRSEGKWTATEPESFGGAVQWSSSLMYFADSVADYNYSYASDEEGVVQVGEDAAVFDILSLTLRATTGESISLVLSRHHRV